MDRLFVLFSRPTKQEHSAIHCISIKDRYRYCFAETNIT